MAMTPPDPAGRWPRRAYDVALGDVVGWDERTVLAKLGPPDSRGPGNAWPEEGPGLVTMRGPGGELRPGMPFFGVLPRTIARLVPYEAWSYHNVGGATWVLYLVREGATALPSEPRRRLRLFARWLGAATAAATSRGGARRVVETTSYPTGAVF